MIELVDNILTPEDFVRLRTANRLCGYSFRTCKKGTAKRTYKCLSH